MKNKSKVVLSKRATKFKNMGGPRKYPRKYVWQIIDNKLSLQEVTYFSGNDAYYFFTYEAGKPMVRNSRVPSDLTLFDSVSEAYKNVPTPDKWEIRGEEFDPSYWIKSWMKTIKSSMSYDLGEI